MPKKIDKNKKANEKLIDYAADRLASILVQQLDYEKTKKKQNHDGLKREN